MSHQNFPTPVTYNLQYLGHCKMDDVLFLYPLSDPVKITEWDFKSQ